MANTILTAVILTLLGLLGLVVALIVHKLMKKETNHTKSKYVPPRIPPPTSWISKYPEGYCKYRAATGWKLHERRLDDYLANCKNNNLEGLRREDLIEILCLDHHSFSEQPLEPIEHCTEVKLLNVGIKTIPIRELLFLFPRLEDVALDVTSKARLEDLLKIPRLSFIFICGPEIKIFPYFLSELQYLKQLTLFDAKITEINFSGRAPFSNLRTLGIGGLHECHITTLEGLESGLPRLGQLVAPVEAHVKLKALLLKEYGARGHRISLKAGF